MKRLKTFQNYLRYFILTIAILFSFSTLQSQILNKLAPDLIRDFIPSKLIFKDSTSIEGYARIPFMMDEFVKYTESKDSRVKKAWYDDLDEIIFYEDNEETHYKKIVTYSNYRNKFANTQKSWLKVLRNDYMSLYYGYEAAHNSPSMNMWYCKKASDTIAFFISMKYSGGMVYTIGKEKGFKKNASYYFEDYKELSEKILNSIYKFDNLELIVDLYNEWYHNQNKK